MKTVCSMAPDEAITQGTHSREFHFLSSLPQEKHF